MVVRKTRRAALSRIGTPKGPGRSLRVPDADHPVPNPRTTPHAVLLDSSSTDTHLFQCQEDPLHFLMLNRLKLVRAR